MLTVSELTTKIKKQLEPQFRSITVEGEISNFKAQQSGHYYFTLKDEQSQIAVSFFNAAKHNLSRVPKDGDKVVLVADINVYLPRGNYQLVVQSLKFSGLGDLLLRLHQLKEQIEKLGWFKKEHKKLLPKNPKVIGVITSPTGAVIQDIIQVLRRRRENFHLILYPVKVQGEGAKEEISRAIQEMNHFQLADVLIVGRGGGSIEDLWAFNEKEVAEAIFLSNIPVISAVGHETDFTIADFVADLRAPTPSAAAEIVLEKTTDLMDRFGALQKRLDQLMQTKLKQNRLHLNQICKHPFCQGHRLLHPFMQKIDYLVDAIDLVMDAKVVGYKNKIALVQSKVKGFEPKKRVQDQKGLLKNLNHLLEIALLMRLKKFEHNLKIFQSRIESLAPNKTVEMYSQKLARVKSHLEALHPKNILKKGYCIPQEPNTNKVIMSVSHAIETTSVELVFHDGILGATIHGIRSSV